MWQPNCRKLGEKFNSNLGNEVAENEGKKEEDLGRKLEEKKIVAIDVWQWNCRNGRKRRLLLAFIGFLQKNYTPFIGGEMEQKNMCIYIYE